MKQTGPRGGYAQSAFTLIEVLVVIVILSILAAFIVPNFIDKPEQARVVKAKQDIVAIGSALDMYKLDHHKYPTTQQGLEALVKTRQAVGDSQAGQPYLPKMPVDPWGHPYKYLSPGQHGSYDLWSLGADGQPGGSGFDADIHSWDQ